MKFLQYAAASILILFPIYTLSFAEGETSFLSDLERSVLEELNLARSTPSKYADYLREWRKYYGGPGGREIRVPGREIIIRTQEGVRAVDEAIRFLEKQKPITPLRISKGMSLGARDHVADTGKRGSIGHTGGDRSNPADRIGRYGKWDRSAGENITYGDMNGREAVMGLIIDDGVPGRGHRKNNFNAEYIVTGIACGPHKKYRTMCVITFAGGYTEK